MMLIGTALPAPRRETAASLLLTASFLAEATSLGGTTPTHSVRARSGRPDLLESH